MTPEKESVQFRPRKQSDLRSASHRARRSGHQQNLSDAQDTLPTTADLATSFLQAAPQRDKAQLEAAIASTSHFALDPDSASIQEGVLDPALGTGTSLALPSFLASFLKGVVDRLAVLVKGVEVKLDLELKPDPSFAGHSGPKPDLVTLLLRIENVEIDGVRSGAIHTGFDSTTKQGDAASVTHVEDAGHNRGEVRRIGIYNVRALLVSDAALFASLSRPSGLSSPEATQSSLASVRTIPKELPIHTDAQAPGGDRSHASVLDPNSGQTSKSFNAGDATGHANQRGHRVPRSLDQSISTSDGGRFADLSDDDDEAERGQSSSHGLRDSIHLAQTRESRPVDHVHTGDASSTLTSQVDPLPKESTASQPGSESLSLEMERSTASSIQTAMEPKVESESVSHHEQSRDTGESQGPLDDMEDSDEIPSPAVEELATSKIFSHEEAESMYMSALSHKSGSNEWHQSSPTSSPTKQRGDALGLAQAPAGLSGSVEAMTRDGHTGKAKPTPDASERLGTSEMKDKQKEMVTKGPEDLSPGALDGRNDSRAALSYSQHSNGDRDAPDEDDRNTEGSPTSVGPYSRIAKHVFLIDEISIWVPSTVNAAEEAFKGDSFPDRDTGMATDRPFQSAQDSSVYPHMPGAFSTSVTERSLHGAPTPSDPPFPPSESLHASTSTHQASNLATASGTRQSPKALEIRAGTTRSQVDVSMARLFIRITQQLVGISQDESLAKERSDGDHPEGETSIRFRAERISLKLLERLPSTDLASSHSSRLNLREEFPEKPADADVLLRTTLKGVGVSSTASGKSSSVKVSITKALLGYATDDIISFDAGLKMRSSTRDALAPIDKDISVTITQTLNSRKVSLATLPLHISLDLQRLDETFSWFGGFSSVIGLGSSIASTTTITGVSPAPVRSPDRPKGVHFAPSHTSHTLGRSMDTVSAEKKMDARLGGIVVDLIGRECSVLLETTALKVVSRDEGIGAQVDRIQLSGPHLQVDSAAALKVELGNNRFEYLTKPKEADLARLLGLLTPSGNKYDEEDDILLDTLLRQRQQGAVIRFTITTLKSNVSTHGDVSYLTGLGEEISKLSAVTKYLPDDDRPGILTLALIKNLELGVDVNGSVGRLNLESQNIEVAHVGLPSLIALSVETAALRRNENEELLGKALYPQSSALVQRPPMMMARMIGDEMEPTIKIKLLNVRVEYRVGTLMALVAMQRNQTTEEALADLAGSVVTLTDRPAADPSMSGQPHQASSNGRQSPVARPLKLEVVLRDCIVGLNPLDLRSKGLIILTETRFTGGAPKKEHLRATLEIGKASLLITDDADNLDAIDERLASPRPHLVEHGNDQVSELCALGFVSVSYISSAKAVLQVVDSSIGGNRSIDLELKDDLLVLETCADSTQTLLGLLNGLKPPVPRSQDLKYRTEIIPVQDMLASLSGDAFDPSGRKRPADNLPLDMIEEDMVEDDVPHDLDFVSSYYGPRTDPVPEDLTESMLADGFGDLEMGTRGPTKHDKRLLESFHEQYQVSSSEPLEFLENHFGSASVVEGTAHKWDSERNTYGPVNEYKVLGSPIRVRVRDVHVIWNLFDGYDWQRTRDTITRVVHQVELEAAERRGRHDRRTSSDFDEEDESVIGDFLFNSIYIGIPVNRDPRDLSSQINRDVDDRASETESQVTTTTGPSPSQQPYPPRLRGKKLRLKRSKQHKMAFELKGICMDLVLFPPGSGETQSSLDVRIRDLEIFDLVPSSTWKKFATYMYDAGERESGTNMVHLEILNVKPVPDLAASEIVVKV